MNLFEQLQRRRQRLGEDCGPIQHASRHCVQVGQGQRQELCKCAVTPHNPQRRTVGAVLLLAARTTHALATADVDLPHNPPPNPAIALNAPCGHNLANKFVPQNATEAALVAPHQLEIGRADPCHAHPHQRLTRPRHRRGIVRHYLRPSVTEQQRRHRLRHAHDFIIYVDFHCRIAHGYESPQCMRLYALCYFLRSHIPGVTQAAKRTGDVQSSRLRAGQILGGRDLTRSPFYPPHRVGV